MSGASSPAASASILAPAALRERERVNVLTHLVGSVLALAGLLLLVLPAARAGDALRILSFGVYGGSLLLVFVSSTAYHASCGPLRPLLQRLDHLAVFALIAGTWTPIALLRFPPALGIPVLGVVWSVGALGMGNELVRGVRGERLSIAIYLTMGWMAVLLLAPILEHLPLRTVAWIFAGGFCYTLGVVFYLWERLPRSHEIWHVFVLGGSACHFAGMLAIR